MRRRMVINRVYKRERDGTKDREIYMDQAITLSYWVVKGQGKDFQRQEYTLETVDLLDPADTGPEFICESFADLEAAAANFRAQMGD